MEILELIITQKLDSNIRKLVLIFDGFPDIDELLALKR
jgi:hypothetical protein